MSIPSLYSREEGSLLLPVSILIVMSDSQQSINVKLNPLSSGGKEPDNNIFILLPKRNQSLFCYLTQHSEEQVKYCRTSSGKFISSFHYRLKLKGAGAHYQTIIRNSDKVGPHMRFYMTKYVFICDIMT